MKSIVTVSLFILLLAAVPAYSIQPGLQAATPTTTPAVSPISTPEADATPGTPDEAALVWEGDPLPEDNQDECSSLRITADGQVFTGPCGAADNPVELFAGQPGGWQQILSRFAPFEAETEQGQITFQGQGQILSPAWQRAIETWARYSYLELSSGRVSASLRTVMSWWMGELPDQPGMCRHLVVLNYGYAYSNITPCEGGPVEDTIDGWFDTAEWATFDEWLYNRASLSEQQNYFSGLGATEMDEAEAAALADWAEDVYTRLRLETVTQAGPGAGAQGSAAGCPEATAGTQLLQNPEQGYCLLYPAEYTVEQPSENATVLVIDSLLNAADPRLHIEVAPAEGRTVEEVADQLEADYSVPGVEIERRQASIGGELAIVLDNVPAQDITRRVVFIHNDRVYNLMFAPAGEDAGEPYERMEQLYAIVIDSFTFTPEQ